MSTARAENGPEKGSEQPDLERLRARMHRMGGGVARLPVAVPAELDGVVQLRTGGCYQVDSAGLAFALLAAASREGAWTALVGVDDLGVEAAAAAGVELDRTVVVPDPGEHWLEATAALVDALPMVLLRPPARVPAGQASRLAARLRKRSATLLAQGAWPGCEARLSVSEARWQGLGAGRGRLSGRRVVVSCRRGSAPARETEIWLPGPTGGIATVEQPALEVALDLTRETG